MATVGPNIRYVRTSEGQEHYGIPIGSPITVDVIKTKNREAAALGIQPPKGAIEDGKGQVDVAAERMGVADLKVSEATLTGPNGFSIQEKEYTAPAGARIFKPRNAENSRYVMTADGGIYGFNINGQVEVPSNLAGPLSERFENLEENDERYEELRFDVTDTGSMDPADLTDDQLSQEFEDHTSTVADERDPRHTAIREEYLRRFKPDQAEQPATPAGPKPGEGLTLEELRARRDSTLMAATEPEEEDAPEEDTLLDAVEPATKKPGTWKRAEVSVISYPNRRNNVEPGKPIIDFGEKVVTPTPGYVWSNDSRWAVVKGSKGGWDIIHTPTGSPFMRGQTREDATTLATGLEDLEPQDIDTWAPDDYHVGLPASGQVRRLANAVSALRKGEPIPELEPAPESVPEAVLDTRPWQSLAEGDKPNRDFVVWSKPGTEIGRVNGALFTPWTKQPDDTWRSNRGASITNDEMIAAIDDATVITELRGTVVHTDEALYPGAPEFGDEAIQAAYDGLVEHSGFQVFYGIPQGNDLRDRDVVSALTTEARRKYQDLSPKQAVLQHLRDRLGIEGPASGEDIEVDSAETITVGAAEPKSTGVQGMNGGVFSRKQIQDAVDILEAFQGKAFKSELNKKGNALGVLDPAAFVGIHKDKTVAKGLFIEHLRGILDANPDEPPAAPEAEPAPEEEPVRAPEEMLGTSPESVSELDSLPTGSSISVLGRVYEKRESDGAWQLPHHPDAPVIASKDLENSLRGVTVNRIGPDLPPPAPEPEVAPGDRTDLLSRGYGARANSPEELDALPVGAIVIMDTSTSFQIARAPQSWPLSRFFRRRGDGVWFEVNDVSGQPLDNGELHESEGLFNSAKRGVHLVAALGAPTNREVKVGDLVTSVKDLDDAPEGTIIGTRTQTWTKEDGKWTTIQKGEETTTSAEFIATRFLAGHQIVYMTIPEAGAEDLGTDLGSGDPNVNDSPVGTTVTWTHPSGHRGIYYRSAEGWRSGGPEGGLITDNSDFTNFDEARAANVSAFQDPTAVRWFVKTPEESTPGAPAFAIGDLVRIGNGGLTWRVGQVDNPDGIMLHAPEGERARNRWITNAEMSRLVRVTPAGETEAPGDAQPGTLAYIMENDVQSAADLDLLPTNSTVIAITGENFTKRADGSWYNERLDEPRPLTSGELWTDGTRLGHIPGLIGTPPVRESRFSTGQSISSTDLPNLVPGTKFGYTRKKDGRTTNYTKRSDGTYVTDKGTEVDVEGWRNASFTIQAVPESGEPTPPVVEPEVVVDPPTTAPVDLDAAPVGTIVKVTLRVDGSSDTLGYDGGGWVAGETRFLTKTPYGAWKTSDSAGFDAEYMGRYGETKSTYGDDEVTWMQANGIVAESPKPEWDGRITGADISERSRENTLRGMVVTIDNEGRRHDWSARNIADGTWLTSPDGVIITTGSVMAMADNGRVRHGDANAWTAPENSLTEELLASLRPGSVIVNLNDGLEYHNRVGDGITWGNTKEHLPPTTTPQIIASMSRYESPGVWRVTYSAPGISDDGVKAGDVIVNQAISDLLPEGSLYTEGGKYYMHGDVYYSFDFNATRRDATPQSGLGRDVTVVRVGEGVVPGKEIPAVGETIDRTDIPLLFSLPVGSRVSGPQYLGLSSFSGLDTTYVVSTSGFLIDERSGKSISVVQFSNIPTLRRDPEGAEERVPASSMLEPADLSQAPYFTASQLAALPTGTVLKPTGPVHSTAVKLSEGRWAVAAGAFSNGIHATSYVADNSVLQILGSVEPAESAPQVNTGHPLTGTLAEVPAGSIVYDQNILDDAWVKNADGSWYSATKKPGTAPTQSDSLRVIDPADITTAKGKPAIWAQAIAARPGTLLRVKESSKEVTYEFNGTSWRETGRKRYPSNKTPHQMMAAASDGRARIWGALPADNTVALVGVDVNDDASFWPAFEALNDPTAMELFAKARIPEVDWVPYTPPPSLSAEATADRVALFREYVSSTIQFFEHYPQLKRTINVGGVRAEAKNNAMAWVNYSRSTPATTSIMRFHMNQGMTEHMRMQHSTSNFHLRGGRADVNAPFRTVVHESGHLLDTHTGMRLGFAARDALDEYVSRFPARERQLIRSQFGTYSHTNVKELVGETMEAWHSFDDPGEAINHVMAAIQEEYRRLVPGNEDFEFKKLPKVRTMDDRSLHNLNAPDFDIYVDGINDMQVGDKLRGRFSYTADGTVARIDTPEGPAYYENQRGFWHELDENGARKRVPGVGERSVSTWTDEEIANSTIVRQGLGYATSFDGHFAEPNRYNGSQRTTLEMALPGSTIFVDGILFTKGEDGYWHSASGARVSTTSLFEVLKRKSIPDDGKRYSETDISVIDLNELLFPRPFPSIAEVIRNQNGE